VRRIKRILPAAFVVLVASLVIMLVAIPRTVWSATLAQIESASVYIVNWVLAAQSVDYLAADQPPTIVEHYWSLSVEEQFYIIWPVLLVVVLALAQRFSRRSIPNTRARICVVAVLSVLATIASFIFSLYLTEWDPSLAYFNTFARAWEFGAGVAVAALAALLPGPLARLRDHWFWGRSRTLSALGIALIFVGAFTIDGDTLFPAPIGLIPVLGALLVIVGGSSRRWALGSVLGIRPVQFLGDVSYSAYLWHWPFIIWFTYAFGHDPSWRSGLLIMAATVLVAWLSKILIEDPVRRSAIFARLRWPAYTFAAGGAALITVLVISMGVVAAPKPTSIPASSPCSGASAILSGSDCKDPFVLPESVDLAAASKDLDTAHWCLTWYTEKWRTCEIGDVSADSRGTFALVGDSYAASFTVAMDDYFKAHGWKVETYTRFGCPGLGYPNPDVKPTTSDAQEYINCRTWSERVRKELLSRTDIAGVVFINRTPDASTPQDAWSQLSAKDIEDTWTTLANAGKKIVAVTTSPDLKVGNVPTCLSSHGGENAPCSRPRQEVVLSSAENTAEAEMKSKVTSIDMTDAFCDSATCYSVIGGVVVYADERHVSTTYSKSIMPYLGPRILAAIGGDTVSG